MLIVEENYVAGVPQTAPEAEVPGWAPTGQCWHWTAGGTGRRGALSTIQDFINTRYTVNASYHLLIWVEHEAGHVGCRTYAMWVVRSSRAAHSISPSASWQYSSTKDVQVQNERFVEVRRILGDRWADPNAACIAVSYCGMPGDLERDMVCPVFIEDCRELARQLGTMPSMDDRPLFGHGWIQPLTRYEMDVSRDFIAMLYGQETTMRLLESGEALMQGRLLASTGIVRLPLYDGELLAELPEGTQLGIIRRMPAQGSYPKSDGTFGRDWLEVEVGLELGYVEDYLVGDRFTTDAGNLVVPPPAPVEVPTGITEADVEAAEDRGRDAGFVEGRDAAAAAAAAVVPAP